MNCRILCIRDHVKLYLKTNSIILSFLRFRHSQGKHASEPNVLLKFYVGLCRNVHQNLIGLSTNSTLFGFLDSLSRLYFQSCS